MATATVASAGPRYAPEDPTLPKPWKGLVDGKTGYLYFWNPETNVTQYERPAASSNSASLQRPSPASISSSVQVQQSSQGQRRDSSYNDDDDRYGRGSSGGSKLASETRSYQTGKDGSNQLQNIANGDSSKGYGPSVVGNGVSAESYRRRHEITVSGNNVPPPFSSFEASGFPSEILREVRYLLQGGAKCRTLCHPPLGGTCIYLERPHVMDQFCEGLSESSNKFVAETAVGDDSVCHLVRTEEEASTCLIACISKHLLPVQQAGFSAPTPIQAQSWPIALQSRDIIAVAKTGSGKTLGYLIPSFIHLKRSRNNPQMGPTVLVLSPTRELATQIQDEAVKFGKSSRISCTCLYGGAPKGPQLRDLDRGTDIVVATPGRLNDILEMKRVSLHQVSYLVLDEADRMLDMGFEPQIRKIVKEVPTRRQTLMYTATWPKEVRKIAADLLVNPVQVNIGNIDELVANKSITQHVEVLAPMEKHRRLEQILRSQEPGSKVIIFCSTKKMCDQLARNLTRQFGAAAIHGDKSQGERDHVLNQFRTGKSPVLVATDVAARGLDIKDIRVVVNYDFPTGVEDYVHRIGRTGRAGATGLAYTFFGDLDGKHASDLIKVLEGANQRVPGELREMASRGGGFGRARRPWGSSSSGGRDSGGRGGGRNDSGYGGRDGGRGSWGMSERGGRGSDRDSDRYGRSSNDNADGSDSHQYKSFHDRMVRSGDGARARSRSKSPTNKGSGWGDRSRARSRSPERFDRAAPARDRSPPRSFHKLMMEKSRSSPPRLRSPSDGRGAAQKGWGPSHDEGYNNGGPHPSSFAEEEMEEGMIPADDDGAFQAAE